MLSLAEYTKSTQQEFILDKPDIKGDSMAADDHKKKDNKNIIFVSVFIGAMLIWMLGTVIYVTNNVANCSSAKKIG
jgi:hypothetical protein